MKYKSIKELQSRIDAYFKKCEGSQLVREGEPVYDKQGRPVIVGDKPPTVTGLALAVGFTSRRELLRYRGEERYQEILLRAVSRCEEYAEMKLYESTSGVKYQLMSNFEDWGEEGEIEGGGKEVIEVVIQP